MMSRKAVMGVGMLLIFVSTILVSAVAAGVLIRTTGLMQESALDVAGSTQNRIVTGIDVFTAYALANSSQDKVYGFEFFVRLRAGSPPIQFRNLGLSYISEEESFSASLNESLMGSCTIANLAPEAEFCITPRLGNNDTVLDRGESLTLLYKLSNSSVAGPEQRVEFTFQPKEGALETIDVAIPGLILTNKVRLR